MLDLLTLATEGGALEEGQIAYTSWLAKVALPLGILIFFGGPYLLLRSNLGTLRAYLVLATSFFGFMLILSLFWGFGAPGTPPNTGPTNLPGQVADEYRPIWVPFAADSTVAGQEPYAALVTEDAEFPRVDLDNEDDVDTGIAPPPRVDPTAAIDSIQSFFASDEGGNQIGDTWAVVEEEVGLATAANGQPVLRATFGETYQPDEEGNLPEDAQGEAGDLIPDGDRFTALAFFDAGSPFFPSIVMILLSLAFFVLHAALLHWDENRERREAREDVATQEAERVPAGATAAP